MFGGNIPAFLLSVGIASISSVEELPYKDLSGLEFKLEEGKKVLYYQGFGQAERHDQISVDCSDNPKVIIGKYDYQLPYRFLAMSQLSISGNDTVSANIYYFCGKEFIILMNNKRSILDFKSYYIKNSQILHVEGCKTAGSKKLDPNLFGIVYRKQKSPMIASKAFKITDKAIYSAIAANTEPQLKAID